MMLYVSLLTLLTPIIPARGVVYDKETGTDVVYLPEYNPWNGEYLRKPRRSLKRSEEKKATGRFVVRPMARAVLQTSN